MFTQLLGTSRLWISREDPYEANSIRCIACVEVDEWRGIACATTFSGDLHAPRRVPKDAGPGKEGRRMHVSH